MKKLMEPKNILQKFNKVVKKISKFNNYYILRQEENAVIIACRPMIYQLVPYTQSVFTPRNQEVNKKLPLFFMLTSRGKDFNSSLIKEFIEKELPILYTESTDDKLTIDDLQEKLAKFVFSSFHT